MTARQIVTKVQARVCAALNLGPSGFDEEELFDSYREFLRPRIDIDENVEEWGGHIKLFSDGSHKFAQRWPRSLTGGTVIEVKVQVEFMDPTAMLKISQDTNSVGAEVPLWASISRMSFRLIAQVWTVCRGQGTLQSVRVSGLSKIRA